MNCERARHYIALETGGDLDMDDSHALLEHLDSCDDCRRDAEGFAESQRLLRAYEPPEFDAAFFDAVRLGVRREIEAARRPALLSSLASRLFAPRALAYAVAFALLVAVVAAGLVLLNGSRRGHTSPPYVAGGGEGSPAPAVVMSPKYDGGAVPAASPTRLPDRPTERIRNVAATSNFRPRRTAEGVARATREKSSHDASARAEAASESQQDSAADVHTGAVAVVQTPAGSEVAERKMLRIELQTADPNVRIIWFSPQTNDGPPRR